MKNQGDDISNLIKEEQKELIELTSELVKIPSSKNDNARIYSFAEDYLNKCGFNAFRNREENPFMPLNDLHNVYVRFGDSKKGKKKILLNGHLDTVPVSSGWFFSPYSGVVEDGRLYGVGSSDMKGGCAAAIIALKALKRICGNIDGEVFLNLVYGEEDSFSFGTDSFLREFDAKKYDLVIIPEPSPLLGENSYCITHKKVHKVSFPTVITGAEGRALFQIDFSGRPAHASQPSKGINAIHDASRLINALLDLDFFTNIKMGRGEYCILNLTGGSDGFTIPGKCSIEVNRHLVVGETWKTAMKEIKRILKRLNLKSKVMINKKFSPTLEHEYNPYISRNTPLIEEFKKGLNPTHRNAVCNMTTRSVGDFNFFATRAKIPVVVFGPGGGNIHSANEFVNVSDLEVTAEHILDFFLRIFNQ
ncbi:MAG: M20 family metallopeptidase [Candidatus Muiribacteriaceae bacterium]